MILTFGSSRRAASQSVVTSGSSADVVMNVNSSSSFPDVQVHIVDAPPELGFTRVRQYHCPSRQQPTWMRRPGIHTPCRGYGFRARSPSAKLMLASILPQGSRPGMTTGDTDSTNLKA